MCMKKRKWGPLALSLLVTAATAALGAAITRRGMPAYEQLVKPPLTPPSLLFPIVWSILFLLMALGAAMIGSTRDTARRRRALSLYGAQLIANVFWSFLFFGLGRHWLAFIWLLLLWALILGMIFSFSSIRRPAGYLQIPYLLWVSFAAYLNLGIALLNKTNGAGL